MFSVMSYQYDDQVRRSRMQHWSVPTPDVGFCREGYVRRWSWFRTVIPPRTCSVVAHLRWLRWLELAQLCLSLKCPRDSHYQPGCESRGGFWEQVRATKMPGVGTDIYAQRARSYTVCTLSVHLKSLDSPYPWFTTWGNLMQFDCWHSHDFEQWRIILAFVSAREPWMSRPHANALRFAFSTPDQHIKWGLQQNTHTHTHRDTICL